MGLLSVYADSILSNLLGVRAVVFERANKQATRIMNAVRRFKIKTEFGYESFDGDVAARQTVVEESAASCRKRAEGTSLEAEVQKKCKDDEL